MNDKAAFANTINTFGEHAALIMSECERYGITWGCDEDCPVYLRGECRNEDSINMIQKKLKDETLL